MSDLPNPHRIITYTKPDGKCVAIDDYLTPQPAAGGLLEATSVFVQADFPANPDNVEEYASKKIEGFCYSKGVTCFTVDIKPGHIGPFHYSDTVDYCIVTHGTLDFESTDGQKWTVGQGDIMINAGNVRYWHNKSDKWARMFGCMSPAKEFVSKDGKTLEQLHPDVMHIPTMQ